MKKNTSILLGDYFNSFISEKIKSGTYSSASEVIRAALRLFELEESKKSELIKALKKGEQSGFVEDFDRNENLKRLHQTHSTSNGKNNKVQGPKEVAIQQVSNMMDIVILGYDVAGAGFGGFGGPIASAFAMVNKFIIIGNMQDCLCDQCGARLSKPGC